MDGLYVSIGDDPEGQGLVGTSLRSGRPAICNDTQSNPSMAPWHQRLAEHNLNSAACFPVTLAGGQRGGLIFYSTEPDFFTAEEETLLGEICEDIRLGIEFAVSERRRAEAERDLERERSLLRTLVRTIPDLVWLKDAEGVYLACNPAFEKLFGAGEEAILGHTDYDFRTPAEADFFRAMDREAMAAGKPKTNEEWVRHAVENRKVLLETTKTPMADGEGRVIGVLGIARDITTARQLQNALLESEDRFRRLVKLAPVPLAFFDRRGRVVYFNDRFIRLFGYSRPDLPDLAACWRRALPQRAYRARIMRAWGAAVQGAAEEGRDVQPLEVEVTCRDGRTRLVEVTGLNIEDTFLATFLDVTERRRAEQERERSDRLESLGVLAGGIAHDFNNILTAIGGNLSLAQRQLGEGHPACGRLQESERAVERATHIVRQLLTFARGGEPVRQVVATASLVREVVDFSLQGTSCRGQLDLADDLWCLDADRDRFTRSSTTCCSMRYRP